MTPEQIARGRRAVACLGWRWMPGMLACDAAGMYVRVVTVEDEGIPVEWSHKPPEGLSRIVTAWGTPGWAADVWGKATPVLEDPATLGCLMALAREALGEPEAHAVKYAYHWGIERHDSYSEGPPALRHDGAWDATWCADAVSGLDEPEAWLAALEAAGRKDADGV